MKRKHMKLVAIFLAISLAAPFTVFFNAMANKQPAANAAAGSPTNEAQEKATAADISNMTGVKAEDILKLREEGLNWNQVLTELKSNSYTGADKEQNSRLQTLAGEGISENVVNELVAKGYSHDEIMEAKLVVERVQFQLEEIVNGVDTPSSPAPSAPAVTALTDPSAGKGNLEAYRKVAGSYNPALAVSLMLELKDAFGGLEQVLNEYLLTLQVGLDLEKYSSDPAAYKKSKEQATAGLIPEDIVTVSSIEKLSMETLQEQNKNNRNEEGEISSTLGHTTPSKEASANAGPLPDSPVSSVPVVKDVKPMNPTEAVMNEIKTLNPNK